MFAQSIINGLLIGGVYALVAVGLNLMFGVMKLVNFAHGEFLMAGMYVAVALTGLALPQGLLGIYWVALPTMLIMAVVGCAFYILLLDRAAHFGENPQILLTIGLSIGAQGLAQVLRGSDFKLVPNPINGASVHFGAVHVQIGPAISFAVALVVTVLMAWVLRATRFGKSARAVAENVETAEMLGIDARKVFVVSTAIAIGLVGLAGALLAPYHYTFPNVGQNFVVVAFLAIVIAGLGSVVGAVFGGLLLGVIQSLTASYLDLDLSTAAIYVLFLAVLLLRPQGLFTRGQRVL
ncbi:MAG TPA: branched-chain amino acid ABC transporter permease [Ramlibacter sp.]|nr:branched-chain amino acid ABC transporter permease [Ramlibacter sp.]